MRAESQELRIQHRAGHPQGNRDTAVGFRRRRNAGRIEGNWARVGIVVALSVLAACAPAAWISAQEGAVTLPAGFRMETFASGLGAPRFMAVSPSGDLFVSIPSRGQVVVLLMV
jgi:hypothetical protein